MHTCQHSYGGAFPSTDENSKTITVVMKTCCNRAMPTGGNTLFSICSSPSLWAAVSYSRKRIGNNSEICAICPVCVLMCEYVRVGLKNILFSKYYIELNWMGVTFGKTCKHNSNLKALDYVLLTMTVLKTKKNIHVLFQDWMLRLLAEKQETICLYMNLAVST